MAKLTEIRWHGRGGQGAKTAALLFGEAVLGQGKYMQAFPEYGPERMGAPVQSFNRISEEPITLHCHVTNPQIVVVLDPTLISTVDVTHGLPADGTIIINTGEAASKFRSLLKLDGQKLYTVDASKIAEENIGRNIPNTPMMGALAKATGLLDFRAMLDDTRKKLEKKFRSKPEVIEGNLKAMQRAYDEAKSG
ncbi:MAG TPA: 2-oxoacid:acceptor oxidoreductase family protein [Armatimonadota bacterium]|nr:2-oxoacid:acceptor oxidoreductase family protein [Armatimonadota bacterium]